MISSRTILAIDTSTRLTSACLLTASGELVEEEVITTASHDQELYALVQRCLERARVQTKALDALVVGSGPGSFTGLRIGYSFAQGFCMGRRIPLMQASTLTAWAKPHLKEKLVLTLIDARRSEYFCAAWRDGNLVWPASIMSDAAIWKQAEVHKQGLAVLVVSDTEIPNPPYPVHLPGRIAYWLLQAAVDSGEGGLAAFNVPEIASASPNYLRAVSAKTIAERKNLGG
ncbi:MAG: tRNA (adenosine(37)-N6)-threonylcarbamoyltransferase complex dimerization subunit type 1 TsaB [Oligoflexia bacterium]|nr:tRNA (adenosine(37)-N6)-threonylcarbamoyltransferase complex dimerization subunit type 1 TsaB [Oligoflexia bacterium]